LDSGRERAVVSRLTEGCDDTIAASMKILYNTLFDLSRSYQHQLMQGESPLNRRIAAALESTPAAFPARALVASQGESGRQACEKLFDQFDVMHFERLEDVFQAMASGKCRYGVVPMENCAHGSAREVYDLLRRYGFSIVRVARLGSGARFACIARELEIYPGADRMSLMLSLKHTPDALQRVIARFSALEINLNRVEYCSDTGGDEESWCCFELEVSAHSPQRAQLICALEASGVPLCYLGSYSEV